MIKVSEHFYSIQGEGPNVGIPSYLIRFSGCNFRCDDCDSKFSWDKNKGEDLRDVIKNLNIPDQCSNVVITGGEPFLYFKDEDFQILINKLDNKHVEIETTTLQDAGTLKSTNIYRTLYCFNRRIYKYNGSIRFMVSPKLDLNCYEDKSITLEDIFRYYEIVNTSENLQFMYKIVYTKKDEAIIRQFLGECVKNKFFRKNNLFIMPLTPVDLMYPNLFEDTYNTSCEETIEFCKKYGLRYTPRVHIDVYGLERRV